MDEFEALVEKRVADLTHDALDDANLAEEDAYMKFLMLWEDRGKGYWRITLKGDFRGAICDCADETQQLIAAGLRPELATDLPEGHLFMATLMTENTDFYGSAATFEEAQGVVWDMLKDIVLLWSIGLVS